MTVQRWHYSEQQNAIWRSDTGGYVLYDDVAPFLPVTLTADSEEPPVGSVALVNSLAVQRRIFGWQMVGSAERDGGNHPYSWLFTSGGPVTLIWRGEATPQDEYRCYCKGAHDEGCQQDYAAWQHAAIDGEA